ncbi:PTS sugar transporter subunit IIC [Dongshaea marina]|uniref:PTS sugar transporter subunit IIC n=1 Tax=Dongshaea marina TaxID=2047966 RepID=UPI001F1F9AC9|nr:PTS sugar transporter subunit IIC [Dongshaea marina]
MDTDKWSKYLSYVVLARREYFGGIMSSVFSKFLELIENQITPLAGKIGQQKYVQCIRDGFVIALPFIIVGSFTLVFAFPPFDPKTKFYFGQLWLEFAHRYHDQLMLPYNLTMGIMSIFVCFGTAASLARRYGLEPVTAGLLALAGFLIVAATFKDGAISTTYFGGPGVFTALIVAIYSTELYYFLKRKNITIRMPEEVPVGVARSFEALIPVIAIVVSLEIINLIVIHYSGLPIPGAIMQLLKPLVAASDSLPAILLAVLLCQVLWFAGIHGASIVTGILYPFWLTNLAANQHALALGEPLPHIFLQGFWDHYLLIGGVGSTLPLAFLLLFSKSVQLRAVGKMGVVPGFFNINEPILFGAPIIMNPVFFLPFLLVPMLNATLAYFMLKLDIVARVVSLTPWTAPAPIGAAWAANWALSPVILCLVCLCISAILYYPFVKAYEHTLVKSEAREAVEEVAELAESRC